MTATLRGLTVVTGAAIAPASSTNHVSIAPCAGTLAGELLVGGFVEMVTSAKNSTITSTGFALAAGRTPTDNGPNAGGAIDGETMFGACPTPVPATFDFVYQILNTSGASSQVFWLATFSGAISPSAWNGSNGAAPVTGNDFVTLPLPYTIPAFTNSLAASQQLIVGVHAAKMSANPMTFTPDAAQSASSIFGVDLVNGGVACALTWELRSAAGNIPARTQSFNVVGGVGRDCGVMLSPTTGDIGSFASIGGEQDSWAWVG